DLLRGSNQLCDNVGNSQVDTALQVHRVHASGNCLVAFLNDCLSENGRRRGAVTSDVVGLRSNFADQLGAHVLELVFQLDFLGNRHTVLGDARCAEGLVDDDVTALGAKRYLDSVGENIDAAQHALAGITGETYFFSSHLQHLFRGRSDEPARISMGFVDRPELTDDAHDVGFLHDQKVFAIELHFGARPLAEQNAVASLDVQRDQLASFVARAGANGDNFAFLWLFL